MLHCDACGVDIRGNKACCPLCGHDLTGEPEKNIFPVFEQPRGSKRSLVLIITVIFLIYEGVLLSSLAAGFDHGWILVLMLGCLFLWGDLMLSIYFRNNIVKSLNFQLLVVALVAVWIDHLTGWHAWSVSYTVPALFILVALLTIIISQAMHLKLEDYVIYLLFEAVFTLLQLIPILLGKNPHPAFAVGVIILFAAAVGLILLFHFRKFSSASRKWFNI